MIYEIEIVEKVVNQRGSEVYTRSIGLLVADNICSSCLTAFSSAMCCHRQKSSRYIDSGSKIQASTT